MIPSFVPVLAQDLIRGMIDINPVTRLTVSGACEGRREESGVILMAFNTYVVQLFTSFICTYLRTFVRISTYVPTYVRMNEVNT